MRLTKRIPSVNARIAAWLAPIGLCLFGVIVCVRADSLPAQRLLNEYASFDARRVGGSGYAQRTDAATLAWSEAYILQDYIDLHAFTKDEKWLRQIVRHFDAMVGNLTDPDGDGYKGWQTTRYSFARVLVAEDNSRGADLEPVEPWIEDAKRSSLVTGHSYEVTYIRDLAYAIQDLNTRKWLVKSSPYSSTVKGIPQVTLRRRGTPRRGDTFLVKTMKPMPLEYMVHEGMALAPVAQFIEIAYRNPDIASDLKAKAQSYANLILSNFAPKWESCWREFPGGIGVYIEPDSPERWGAGLPLPHNQYLMYAQTFLHLDSAVGNPMLRDRAMKMFSYFRSRLVPNGDAWVWRYRDVYQDNRRTGPIEDASHGSLDVRAALEAYKRGMVFTDSDMIRFANTITKQMWNGSLTNPTLGDYVNSGSAGKKLFTVRNWIALREFDPRIADICQGVFNRAGQPAQLIPTMLAAQTAVSAVPSTMPGRGNRSRRSR